MRKTSVLECNNKMLVDTKELQAMLSCGRQTAVKIGAEAGAEIHYGGRKLYNVRKVQRFIDSL